MKPQTQTKEHLERRLARVAREQGLDRERLRRWVSFLALCGALEKAVGDGILSSYYLKGGVALELRFAMRARATKDLDVGIAGPRADRLAALEQALRLGFNDFTFRAKPDPRVMELADTIRVAVAVQYRTRAWQTIEVDLGPAANLTIDLVEPQVQGLLELGLSVISPVPCLALSDQVAQKLHACSSPYSHGRARDVLDILMIDTLAKLDYSLTAAATRQVFLERATHPFPARFKMPDVWRRELEALALEMGFRDPTSNHLERCFLEIIERLETAD